ncbi:MAG: hypothetical protein ACI88A_000983 [Paraglaciecola sp.]|jgi:hypothetical protein
MLEPLINEVKTFQKDLKEPGFEGVGKIGFYLCSLLQSHNDTLAVKSWSCSLFLISAKELVVKQLKRCFLRAMNADF